MYIHVFIVQCTPIQSGKNIFVLSDDLKSDQTSLSCSENFQQLSDSFRCNFAKILENFSKLRLTLSNFVHLETFSRSKKLYVSAGGGELGGNN